MIEIGKYQTLIANRFVDFGAYLAPADAPHSEVLLPGKYMPENFAVGDKIEVFVYNDSEDRPVATTERPFAVVDTFAFLEVVAVNDTGAFLNWGLPKDLLVPYSEQRSRMKRGGTYLVYVYLDKTTGRIVASAKIDKFLGNVYPEYRQGQKVQVLVYEQTEIGYRCIVDNRHKGMIYSSEIFRPIEIENTLSAFVKRVRPDGKIDITLSDTAKRRTNALADDILAHLSRDNAEAISDKMTPTAIEALFHCSKRDFKEAVGHLYRDRKISIGERGLITLSSNDITTTE